MCSVSVKMEAVMFPVLFPQVPCSFFEYFSCLNVEISEISLNLIRFKSLNIIFVDKF